MAAPTNPTVNGIVNEGLKKAGYNGAGQPSQTIVTRATNQWMEEIKDDIWSLSKGKLKSLQNVDLFGITTAGGSSDNEGTAVWDAPADLAHSSTMQYIQGTHYGVCQSGGSTTTAKLASDEDMSASYAIGKEIILFVTTTQTTAYSSFITNFNTTTKVATFSPAITISATTTNTYIIADNYRPMKVRNMLRYDELWQFARRGEPEVIYPLGRYTDDDDGLGANNSGQFLMFPVPYFNSDSKPRAIRHNYYVNLKKVDITEGSGKLYTAFLNRWETVWKQGIKAKALEDLDDTRADNELVKYVNLIKLLISRETYGYDLSNMQQIVTNDDEFGRVIGG